MDAVARLKSVINIEKWQLLQDALSDVTGMAIVTSDYRGVPITEHSGCKEFCLAARRNPSLSRMCQRCDSRGGLEAIRVKAPYIYRCHLNIVDAAIPIIIDNSYLGSILMGQVLLPDDESPDRLEMICSESELPLSPQGFRDEMESNRSMIPAYSLARVEMIANMLFHLCNYFVSEALEKKAILRLVSEAGAAADPAGASGLENIKKNLNNLIADARASGAPHEVEAPEPPCGNKMLGCVFSYMDAHRAERLSLKEMAQLCHVSPSYFSRLFRRETGENYSAFLLRKRVEWGKALLCSSDMKMANIAEATGFCDAGHFVRSFKKHEGVTPSLFRNMVAERGDGT
jgi:ligand-binding sensor protein/AraC-like DNA-binding protein